MTVIIANIIDFLAAMLQVGTGAIKEKARILIIQTVQLLMQAFAMLLLGGVTGAISNVLSCFRNYLCYKDKLNVVWKVVLIAASIAFTILLNEQGFLGIIPAAVCTIYIIFMDIKDPIKFKLLVTLSFVPWVVYHFMIRSYTGAFFDAATVVTSTVTLIKMIRDKKGEAATADIKVD